ncbi:MAG: hypothetical protein WA786_07345 [Acidimicrobiales bacterium]
MSVLQKVASLAARVLVAPLDGTATPIEITRTPAATTPAIALREAATISLVRVNNVSPLNLEAELLQFELQLTCAEVALGDVPDFLPDLRKAVQQLGPISHRDQKHRE